MQCAGAQAAIEVGSNRGDRAVAILPSYIGTGPQPITAPVPTNVGNIVQFTIPFCGGMTNWNLNSVGDNPFLTVLLCYIANLWQKTVGAINPSDTNDGITAAGNFVVSQAGFEILDVVLHWSGLSQDGYIIKGTPNSGNFGKYAWSRGGFIGPMHQLSWQQQIVFPDIEAPDALYVFSRTPLTCHWFANFRTAGGDPVYIDSSPTVLAEGTLGNVGSAPVTNDSTQFAAAAANFLNTVAVIGGVISTILYFGPVAYSSVLGGYNTGSIYAMVNAYMSELWQFVIVPHIGTTSGSTPLPSGRSNVTSAAGILKAATLAIVPPTPARTAYNYGYTGIHHYGWWAPVYGVNLGDLQYLNFQNCNLLIPGYGATGVTVMLENGCTGTLETSEDVSVVYGSDTPYGHVNLTQGVTSGLDYVA